MIIERETLYIVLRDTVDNIEKVLYRMPST